MAVIVDHPVDDENAAPVSRPMSGDDRYGPMEATRFPPFVFSIRGASCLIHTIARVEIHWWRIAGHGHLLAKLKKPVLIAQTVCCTSFRLDGDIARTCHVPNPDAIPCGRCNGDVAPFGKHGHATKAGLKRQVAHIRLGCVVKGY